MFPSVSGYPYPYEHTSLPRQPTSLKHIWRTSSTHTKILLSLMLGVSVFALMSVLYMVYGYYLIPPLAESPPSAPLPPTLDLVITNELCVGYRASTKLPDQEISMRHTPDTRLQVVYDRMFQQVQKGACVITAPHVNEYVSAMLLRFRDVHWLEMNNPTITKRSGRRLETRERYSEWCPPPPQRLPNPIRVFRHEQVAVSYSIHNQETNAVNNLQIELTGEEALCAQAGIDILEGILHCSNEPFPTTVHEEL